MNNRRRDRIPDLEWESHKETIRQLYLKDDKRLEGQGGVKDVMATTYNFSASKAQFETRLKKWNFRKYAKRNHWRTLEHVIESRKENGKETEVLFDGKLVDPSRVRKETGRHRKCTDNHSYSRVQGLPGYITVKTPPPRHTSPMPQARFSPSPRIPDNQLSFTMPDFAFESPSSSQQSVPLRSSDTGYQSSLFSDQVGGLDSLSNWFDDDTFLACDTKAIYQPESAGYLESLGLLGNSSIGGIIGDMDNMDFTPMNLAIARPASHTMLLNDINSVPDPFTTTSPLFIQVLPVVQQFIRKSGIPKEDISGFPFERFCLPSVSQLVRKQSIDMQILHLIISRLVNDEDALKALNEPETSVDKLFKTGVEHLLSLDAHLLGKVLDSNLTPYTTALEQGLFRAAIEMGAGPTVKAILNRGLDPNRPLRFLRGYPGQANFYPLERSCIRLHVEVARILIDFGADLNKHVNGHPLVALVRRDPHNYFPGERNKRSPAYVEMISMLFNNRATLDPHSLAIGLESCIQETIPIFVSAFAGSSSEMFISNGALAIILRREGFDDVEITAVRTILQCDYPVSFKRSEVWNTVLTAALSNAAMKGQVEVIDILLAAGARPNSNCLIGAVCSKSMPVFERFIDRGLDPNALDKPLDIPGCCVQVELLTTRFSHSLEPTTAISQCVKQDFREAFQIFDQRGFLSELGNRKRSFELTLKAACVIGDVELVDRLLPLQDHKWNLNLNQAFDAAVRAGNETIVRKLLAADIILFESQKLLLIAVQKSHSSLVELLTDIVHFDSFQLSPTEDIIFEAVLSDNMAIISSLIYAGVPLDNEVLIYWQYRPDLALPVPCELREHDLLATPLSVAILKGNREMIELLLQSGALVNVGDPSRRNSPRNFCMTALSASVIKNEPDIFKTLLGRGADPFDNSALYLATVLWEENDILEDLLDAFIKRYSPRTSSFGADALLWAVMNEVRWMVELLIKTIDPNCLAEIWAQRSYWSMSPLGAAIELNCGNGEGSEILSIFLQAGTDPDSVVHADKKSTTKLTALLYAIGLESLKTVITLVDAGADVALPAVYGIKRTPLQAAAEVGNEEILHYLLQQGAHPNEPPATRAGATALQLAAIKGFIGIAATLLEAGGDVNAEPALVEGRTAFEGATEHGRIEMMLFLVQKGADLLSNNEQQYRRAIRFAERNGQAAAKQFADQLFKAVSRNGRTSEIGAVDADMTVPDDSSFGELFPSGGWPL